MEKLRQHRYLLLLLLVYLASAVWLAFRVPAFTMPNEILHYEYVALIRQTGTLPDPATSQRMDERHQPPVYYSLATLFSLPLATPPLDDTFEPNLHPYATVEGNRNPFLNTTPSTVPVLYAGRLVSILFGVIAIAALYAAAAATLGRGVALLVASIMAFQPNVLYLSAAMGNDMAVTAMAAILLAYTTFMIHRNWGWRAYILWGILFAAAMLTKASAVFLGVLLPIACLIRWWNSRNFWYGVRCGIAGFLSFLPLYAIWPLFNRTRQLDALAIEAPMPLDQVLRLSPSEFRLLGPYLMRMWRSFWLDWSVSETGYLETWVYVASGLVLVVLLAGHLRRPRREAEAAMLDGMNLVWMIPLLYLYVSVKALMVKGAGFLVPEGRWLMLAWPSVAWLAATGWARWWSPACRERAVGWAAIVPPATTLIMLVLTIPRLNPQAERLAGPEHIPDSATPVGLVYDGAVELTAVDSDAFVMREPTTSELYWSAVTNVDTDYLVCSRLVIPWPGNWEVVEGRCTYHGNGLTPSSSWEADDLFRDELIHVPNGELNGPTTALLLIDLFRGESGEEASVTLAGEPIETAVAQRVVLRPADALAPNDEALLPAPVAFGDGMELMGVASRRAGAELEVTLWWRAAAEMSRDYTVFVHLVDDTGSLIVQSDSMPNRGQSPTGRWQAGDTIRDRHTLLLEQIPDSAYLSIGVYDLQTLERLPARQNGQPLADDALRVLLP